MTTDLSSRRKMFSAYTYLIIIMIMERYHLVLEFWQMGIVLRIVNKKPM